MFANCRCHVCGDIIPFKEPVYCYNDNDGVEQNYHMLCWKEQTVQGQQGYAPTKIYGPQATSEMPEDLDQDSFGF
jgi:hypothetical protein